MYVHWIRKDTAEDADLYEELRDGMGRYRLRWSAVVR